MSRATDSDNDAGLHAAERFMLERDTEPEHARQVHRTSMKLFKLFEAVHGLDSAARRLLAAAALMHDIGFSVSLDRHHKNACNLILAADLEGFSARERTMILQTKTSIPTTQSIGPLKTIDSISMKAAATPARITSS